MFQYSRQILKTSWSSTAETLTRRYIALWRSEGLVAAVRSALVRGLVAALPGELLMPHASEVASRAAKSITRGRHARRFWVDVIGIGPLGPTGVKAER